MIFTDEYFNKLKDSNVDQDNLIDISSIKIDTSLPAQQRLEQYLSQIKNPYHFKSGKVTVSIGYKENDTIQNIISEYFIYNKL